VTVQQFKVFRAIGIAFKAWFSNFIPITVLAALLYAPAIFLATQMPGGDDAISKGQLDAWQHVVWVIVAGSSLVAPFLTYRVIQYMNGASSSIVSSVTHGFRGIVPVLILAVVTNVLSLVPFGGIIAIFFQCAWFVAGPAAVVERLGPFAALGRSGTLTNGRRGGIFGLCLVVGLSLVVVMVALLAPMVSHGGTSGDFKHIVIVLVPVMCAYQLFIGIVQAVSYSLLRADKDGVSNDDLAKVFE
jgi:hypothetical protein